MIGPTPDVDCFVVANETVLLDGWREAVVLDASGAAVWERIDGKTPLNEIIDDLAATFDTDRDTIERDVTALVEHLARLGFLDGVEVPDDPDAPDITLVPAHVVTEVGETLDDLDVVDGDGTPTRLLATDAAERLLVHWSPHCGYCASILDALADLEPLLDEAGVPLTLFSYGSITANRTQADVTGWHPNVVLKPPHETGPFLGHGTPAAFHIDTDGTLVSPAAKGTDQVLVLAARLAGVDPDDHRPHPREDTRYLLTRGGACAAGAGGEPVTAWTGTRVHRIGDHHIGLRHATDATAAVLDALFGDPVGPDAAAGHIFIVSLPDSAAATARGTGDTTAAGSDRSDAENLLVIGTNVLVGSHNPERVVRALLWHLDDKMRDADTPPPDGLVRTNATAVLTPVGAALLQPGLHGLAERLQPAFARHGIAYVDVVHPLVDLATAELVVPEPVTPHDPTVLARLATTSTVWPDEPAPVRPGRYSLVGWGVIHPSDGAVTPFSPAQAAAATLSSVHGTDDRVARVHQLGDLFAHIDGFGIWYHSETQLADAVAEALDLHTP